MAAAPFASSTGREQKQKVQLEGRGSLKNTAVHQVEKKIPWTLTEWYDDELRREVTVKKAIEQVTNSKKNHQLMSKNKCTELYLTHEIVFFSYKK